MGVPPLLLELAGLGRGYPRAVVIDGEPRGSISEIARGTGLSPSYVSLILAGHRLSSVASFARLAAYLGISMDRLWAHAESQRQQRKRRRGGGWHSGARKRQ
jgi:transcriptional regulator with XRE-family HTH domain